MTDFRNLKLSYNQMTLHLSTPREGKLRQNQNAHKLLPYSEEKPKFSLQPTRPCTNCPITPLPILISSHLPSSHLSSFTLLWPHWAPGCSLNNSGMLLPQGLCTGCSLCLQCSSLTIHLASSLPLSLCSNVICSVTHLLTLLPKIAPNTLPACFTFLHHFHHYLAY